MRRHLKAVLNDPALAQELAAHGLRTVRARHGCGQRVDELMGILAQLGSPQAPAQRIATLAK
jgi:spore maturation protein CgeB